jgi:hypothetical protein
VQAAKNCHHCCAASRDYAGMLGVQNTKYQVLNTWLLSAVYSQATTFPEQSFGSWFWRVVLKYGCLACNVLFHNYIHLGCVQPFTQTVDNSNCDSISFHGFLYPMMYLYVSDHTDWVQWACTCWLQTVSPGEQWYVHPESVIINCWTDNIWKV